MKLKRHINFINEETSSDYSYHMRYSVPEDIGDEDEWIFEGNMIIGRDDEMVDNGEFNQRLPDEVTGMFECSDLGLTTLKGCPKIVGDNFMCVGNLITNLIGGPKEFGGIMYNCNFNKLITLEGAPEYIDGDFNAGENQLTTLKGGPKIVKRSFAVDDNMLTTLEGAPIVGDAVITSGNLVNFEHIEADFVEYNKEDLDEIFQYGYWQGLYNWMLARHYDVGKIKTWPEEFINSLEPKDRNTLLSKRGLNKFDL